MGLGKSAKQARNRQKKAEQKMLSNLEFLKRISQMEDDKEYIVKDQGKYLPNGNPESFKGSVWKDIYLNNV